MVQAPVTDIFGSLSAFPHYDETTHIGTRFPSKATQLSSFLSSDELLKDLATLVSHRGVVFFLDQDITIDQQKELARRMGKLSGNPRTSDLHIHPISEDVPELGKDVSVISSKGGIARAGLDQSTRASKGWHADITFERIPSDYALLKMHTLPPVGGDTLWASGYESYDRLSPAYQRFLEGLHASHSGALFNEYARRHNLPIQDPRGAPENAGSDLTAIHPVIRTNPVTGFKSLFVNQSFAKRIIELTLDESDDVLAYLSRHISENHDLQVRFRWSKNDVAIWDNRSTFHTATNDYGSSLRQGNRVVSLGERPFLDPNSKGRKEVFGIPL
ncbi:taurine catabolism dioxygenase [Guyanagaster necrorhizus]|uniref:Taurine catabolism dioxygenase n=1 Tax=Guyanagaster necrorhizus TaxID=856835 RepID=A0A9P8AZ13_9AGAR|nr:taurine catabolism dioxygenase [Guyanagaster necrorhizus MCA 3950]KAG7453065.1 taurine catabolism dioxygenase [Guyanagaster necrorhizus MCA 3950]